MITVIAIRAMILVITMARKNIVSKKSIQNNRNSSDNQKTLAVAVMVTGRMMATVMTSAIAVATPIRKEVVRVKMTVNVARTVGMTIMPAAVRITTAIVKL